MKILALVVSLSAALVLTGCAVKTSGVKKLALIPIRFQLTI